MKHNQAKYDVSSGMMSGPFENSFEVGSQCSAEVVLPNMPLRGWATSLVQFGDHVVIDLAPRRSTQCLARLRDERAGQVEAVTAAQTFTPRSDDDFAI